MIEVLSLKDPSVPRPKIEDQKAVVASGHGLKITVVGKWELKKRKLPVFWLNPDDVRPQTKYIDSRCIGCCGIGGHDGSNHACKQSGAELGTEESDCYTPYLFTTENKNVDFIREDK